uniref:Uncharacterized protein n=1 Tax=Helianthus annuus TaxID=4232 RepID=A0A251SK23_HELAN
MVLNMVIVISCWFWIGLFFLYWWDIGYRPSAKYRCEISVCNIGSDIIGDIAVILDALVDVDSEEDSWLTIRSCFKYWHF